MKKIVKSLFAVMTMLCFACSNANSMHESSDLGTVQLKLTSVPSDVQCLQITATNDVRSVIKNVTIVNGIADDMPLQGFPTGSVTIGAQAYNIACLNVETSTVATWLSDPITQIIQLVEGTPYILGFTLRPNGNVVPNIDWESDSQQVCNFEYDGNANAGTNSNQDACKLVSTTSVCQQVVDCLKNKSCVTQADVFCTNKTTICDVYVNEF